MIIRVKILTFCVYFLWFSVTTNHFAHQNFPNSQHFNISVHMYFTCKPQICWFTLCVDHTISKKVPVTTLWVLFYLSMQLTSYRLSPDEYGLSINADVALWLDAQAYDNQPPHVNSVALFWSHLSFTLSLILSERRLPPVKRVFFHWLLF